LIQNEEAILANLGKDKLYVLPTAQSSGT